MPEIVHAFLLGYVTEWIYFLEDQFPHPSSDWSPKNHSFVKMDESRRLTKFELTYFIASVTLSSTNHRVKTLANLYPRALVALACSFWNAPWTETSHCWSHIPGLWLQICFKDQAAQTSHSSSELRECSFPCTSPGNNLFTHCFQNSEFSLGIYPI